MESIEKNIITNRACLTGTLLGGVSIIYGILTLQLEKTGMGALARTSLTMLLWIGKFIGCIAIMKYYMTKLSQQWSGVTNAHTFRLGMLSALFSALLIAIYTYVNLNWISPDLLKEQMEMAMSAYSSMLDSNSMQALSKMSEGNTMAVISTISNLIYCFLYGTALSAILSRNIPSRNPFTTPRTDEQ